MPAAIIVTQVTDCWMAASDSEWRGFQGGSGGLWQFPGGCKDIRTKWKTKTNPDPAISTRRTRRHQRNVRQIITLHSSAWGGQLSAFRLPHPVAAPPHTIALRPPPSWHAPFSPAVLQVVAMCRVRGNCNASWIRIRICIWRGGYPHSRGSTDAINALENGKSQFGALQAFSYTAINLFVI